MLIQRLLALLPLALLAAPTPALVSPGPTQEAGRVVVLGFDGADWRTTERMMAAGELPHLAALAAEGTAGPLVSTHPAESAAGWAAINTGANPARNGVPSFIRRSMDATPYANWGHIEPGEARVAELEPGGILGLYVRHGATRVAAVAAIAALLAFLIVLRLVLRVRTAVAAVLALLLAGAAGFGAWRMGQGLPDEVPDVWSNRVRLDGFWIHAARAGVPSVALDAALSFGRPGADGARTLFGLGLPDLRGGSNGEWFVYTTDPLMGGQPPIGFVDPVGSRTGTTFRVDWRDDRIDAALYGPLDFVARAKARARVAAIEAELADPGTGFGDAKPLRAERTTLEKTLAEMGDAGLQERHGVRAKVHKHRVSTPLEVERKDGAYDVTIGGATQRVEAGGWSDYFDVRFDLSPLVKAHALTRVRVVAEEPFQLYVDTLHLDPRNQAFWQPVTEPRSFGAELADLNGGPFETLGWGCLTNQMKDEALPVEVFLEDVEFTLAYRRRLTREMLKKDDWRLLFSVFTTTDRIQHIMYRYYDPGHPQYDAEEADRVVRFLDEDVALRDVVPAIYRAMDSIVGEVRAALAPEDALLLCADHGFTSYRRGMVVNNWLAEEGYLALREDLEGRGSKSLGSSVDWSKTRAYSLGLGMVFLNLEGREPAGIVAEEDADALLAEIAARFEAATDPGNEGASVGRRATILKGLYDGPEPWGSADYLCADLMLGFDENYRVDWQSVQGSVVVAQRDGRAVPGDVYVDNKSAWSGDHASNDPELVSGIFFANRKLRTGDGATFSVLDVAPTALGLLGVAPEGAFDRPPLVED